eukprot:Phypoly_transcript_14314.p1 GENE.Phypoly_transcript_14314~~Phypoly_transcript_14314.p1  ORF type:complete len:322 (+),score=44.98 Phypoly_transcript_14314:112-966(+)
MDSVLIMIYSWTIFVQLFHLMSLPSSSLSSLSFTTFVAQFLWILFPANKNPRPRRPILSILVEDTLPTLAIAILKIFAYEWIFAWLSTCLQEGKFVESSFSSFFVYFYVFALMYVMMDYPFNILNALTPLLTLDYYHFPPFSTWFVFSNSPRVFWGRRYNRLIHTIFKECVFLPLKDYGFSSTFSAFATFFVSAVFHAHLFYRFIGLDISMIAYFLLHGVACIVDAYTGWEKWPKLWGFGAMLLFQLLTVPLFFGPAAKLSPKILEALPHIISLPSFLPVPNCF